MNVADSQNYSGDYLVTFVGEGDNATLVITEVDEIVIDIDGIGGA